MKKEKYIAVFDVHDAWEFNVATISDETVNRAGWTLRHIRKAGEPAPEIEKLYPESSIEERAYMALCKEDVIQMAAFDTPCSMNNFSVDLVAE